MKTYVRFFAVSAVGLFIASFYVALKGAGDEPYTSFRASDAIVQIGVACALMALWITWSVCVAVAVSKKRLPKAALFGLLVSAFLVLLLYQSPAGYVSDLVYWGAVVR